MVFIQTILKIFYSEYRQKPCKSQIHSDENAQEHIRQETIDDQSKVNTLQNDTSNTIDPETAIVVEQIELESDNDEENDEEEVQELDENQFEKYDIVVSSIEENSIVDQYILQIQNRLKRSNGRRTRQQPDEYRNGTLLVSTKAQPFTLDENPKNPNNTGGDEGFLKQVIPSLMENITLIPKAGDFTRILNAFGFQSLGLCDIATFCYNHDLISINRRIPSAYDYLIETEAIHNVNAKISRFVRVTDVMVPSVILYFCSINGEPMVTLDSFGEVLFTVMINNICMRTASEAQCKKKKDLEEEKIQKMLEEDRV
ncbi:hypothetical protein K501DRAFT_277984 [Backusella circina FSU 941]|nr:hypothetical protein K501DRAFT_277984 [Backusella circina FSU 941]